MANSHHSGSVNSFADLKTAMEGHLVAEGWSLSDGILSKGGAFFLLATTASTLSVQAGTGQAGAALSDPSPTAVRIGMLTVADPFTFPIIYELHVNEAPDEVFLVINHGVDRYQVLAFGRSAAPGNAYGQWASGSAGSTASLTVAQSGLYWSGRNNLGDGGPAPRVYNFSGGGFAPGVMGPVSASGGGAGINTGNVNYWIRDGVGWGPTAQSMAVGSYTGLSYLSSLAAALPSSYNQAIVLLPIYAIKCVEDFGTIVNVMLRNARFCRLDNHAAGQVVPFGGENWKVYPAYRRDASTPWPESGPTLHSGVMGYALRYHGA